MQVFEFRFNPKIEKDKIFDSFIYEPESIYEKRLGNLYVVGELNKALPQNTNFLNSLFLALKKEYYSAGLKKTPETSFQDALKKTNEFLDKEVKNGNVSWLGNLNFAVLNFNNYILNFTKTGGIKILLIRGQELLDISQNLEFQDMEPYPLKIFGNIATGKLAENDKIIVLTKEVFSVLSQSSNFFNYLSKISDEKGIKEIFKINKQIFSEVSGVCLFLIVKEELQPQEILTFRKELPKFSFRSLFKFPSFELPFPRLKISFKIPEIKFPFSIPKSTRLYKSGGLILALILILTLGFFIFGAEKEKEFKEARQKLEQAQSKILMAENFLILKKEEEARELFQEAKKLLLPLTKEDSPFQAEAKKLLETISTQP